MSEPEELKMSMPTTPEDKLAYYTARLELAIGEEMYRVLKEQGKSRVWLRRKLFHSRIEIDGFSNLAYVARLFLPLGYHLEVRAVKNEEADHERI